jgi:hypothetical protein
VETTACATKDQQRNQQKGGYTACSEGLICEKPQHCNIKTKLKIKSESHKTEQVRKSVIPPRLEFFRPIA